MDEEKSQLSRYVEYLVLIFALCGLLMSIMRSEAIVLGLCVAFMAICVVYITESVLKRLDQLEGQIQALKGKKQTPGDASS